MSGEATTWRGGGCHCGAVRFEAALPDVVEAQTCNCSICAMTGFLHIIVSESRFRLARGSEHLTSYTFNTGVARHLFCEACGVKSFYRPRSNPDGWSVNGRCLDAAVRRGSRRGCESRGLQRSRAVRRGPVHLTERGWGGYRML